MKKLTLILFLLGMFLISGCNKIIETKEIIFAPFDTIDIEATVLSIDKKGDEYPDDWAILRINSAKNYTRDPKAIYYPPLSPKSIIDSEMQLKFTYSARPSKIRCLGLPETKASNNPVDTKNMSISTPVASQDSDNVQKPLPFENGYYIYEYYTANCPLEKILLGLKEGDKIRFVLAYSGDFGNIGEYELIN